jgi:hypothetical protein
VSKGCVGYLDLDLSWSFGLREWCIDGHMVLQILC